MLFILLLRFCSSARVLTNGAHKHHVNYNNAHAVRFVHQVQLPQKEKARGLKIDIPRPLRHVARN